MFPFHTQGVCSSYSGLSCPYSRPIGGQRQLSCPFSEGSQEAESTLAPYRPFMGPAHFIEGPNGPSLWAATVYDPEEDRKLSLLCPVRALRIYFERSATFRRTAGPCRPHSLGFITWTYRPYRPGSTLLRWAYMHTPWEQSPWEQSFSNNHGNKTENSWPRCAQALWLVPCMLRSWKFLAVMGKVTFKSNALQYCVTP